MPVFRIPSLMKFYTADQTEVPLQGATVAELLTDLVTQYPQIKVQIMDKNGDLRRFVNLFLNDTNIKDLDGVNTSVHDNDRLMLLPSISGGLW